MAFALIVYITTTLLPGISTTAFCLAITLTSITSILWLIKGFCCLGKAEFNVPFLCTKWWYINIVILVLIYNVLPSEKASYVILAAYGIEQIASNESVQQFGSNSLELLEQAISEYLSKEDSQESKPSNIKETNHETF